MTHPNFTDTECAVILGLYQSQPVEDCHSGRGWRHSEACFALCYDSWSRCVDAVSLILSFERKGLDRRLFVESCKVLPVEVRDVTHKYWER